MNQEIKLFLGGKEVFFSEPPEILFTFQRTDYTNPTIIKNNYTKTITIEGTPENNKVFGEIHLLERTQNNELFNPARRVDFNLYVNGDLTETGYAKLDNVIKSGNKISYSITLYGGLGDFFYGLSYGFDYDKYNSNVEQSEDEELKLKDLTYFSDFADDDTEFNFNITKDAIYDAWSTLKDTTHEKCIWDYINFMPAYNGLPDNFDADKVLINSNQYSAGCRVSVPSGATMDGVTYTSPKVVSLTGIPQSVVIEGKSYTTHNGYAFSELREQMTEWEMRDLRSYLQRPVLRVQGLFEAIKRYAEEKGEYTLNLDGDFFNAENPYYSKAWITLPMLTNLTGEYAEAEATGMLDFSGVYNETEIPPATPQGRIVVHKVSSLISNTEIVGLPYGVAPYKGGSVTFAMAVDSNDYFGMLGPSLSLVYRRYNITEQVGKLPFINNLTGNTIEYGTAFNVQLIAYDSNNNVVGESQIHTFTQVEDDRNLIGPYGGVRHVGKFYKIPNTTKYRFVQNAGGTQISGFTVSLADDLEYQRLEMKITKREIYTDDHEDAISHYNNDNPNTKVDLYHQLIDFSKTYRYGNTIVPTPTTKYRDIPYPVNVKLDLSMIKSSVIYTPTDTTMASNQLITKKKLLSQDGTPAKYMIDYCKLFNLYFEKDPIEKVVTIRTRNNFYQGDVIDIEKKIDRSKDIKINPFAADNKWYNFNYTQGDKSLFEEQYYQTWGTDFGKQKTKTDYNFDNVSKDLLEGNIYNNGLTALEKSKYYRLNKNGEAQIPNFLYEWSDFKLFNTTDGNMDGVSDMYIGEPVPTSVVNYNVNGERYDIYPKLQLHTTQNDPIDGSNILVFFNGMKTTSPSNNRIYYNITDDVATMFAYNNGNPCWLFTQATTDINGNVIAKRLNNNFGRPVLPDFSRYLMTGDTISKTWDFGKCNELYAPRISYGESPTIFSNYWELYVSDLYSRNTKVVECYVKLDGKVEGDWLKHFYYFDNSIWCLTKIEDYNVTSFATTKCEFVKVMDIDNYMS